MRFHLMACCAGAALSITFPAQALAQASSTEQTTPTDGTEAAAQDRGSQAAAEQRDTAQADGRVEEITITAQRREQNLQRVPIAVSAFTADTLETLRIDNSTELLKFVPNVISFNNGGQAGQANYYFRGIGTPEGIQTFDPPVLTYIDDVPLGRIGSANIQFLDVERVEVLRGPQGTLFGRNVTGGAVAYHSRKPADQFRLTAVARLGERDHIEGRVSIDVPLSSNLFSQATAYYQKEDGYIRSAFSGAHGYGGFENWGGRLALRFEPSESLTWNIAADYSRQSGTSLSIPGNPTSPFPFRNDERGTLFRSFKLNNLIVVPCTIGEDPVDWARNNCQESVPENMGLTSNISLALGDTTQLSFITGLRRSKQRYSLDFGGNNPNNALAEFILANDSTYDQLSQEVKLTGSLLNDRLKYVTGVFYYDEEDDTIIHDFLRLRGGARFANQVRTLNNTTKSLAAYLQTDFEIVPDLTLTTGVRYTHDKKTVDVDLRTAAGVLVYDTRTISGDPKIKSSRLTPRVSMQYQATPDIMLYGSWTSGFKSGGWNGRAASAIAFNSFGDEKVSSLEVGTRTSLFDRRLRLNITGFYVEYKDLQINTALQVQGNTIFITDNAGDSRAKGIELESTFVVTPELSGNFSAGFQKGKFTRLGSGTLAAGLTLNSPLPQTPEQTYSAGITYSKHIDPAGGALTFTAGGQYIPAYNPGVTGTSIKTEDLLFTNASLSFAPEEKGIEIAIECKNCLRKVQNIYPFQNGNALLGVLPYVGMVVSFRM